VSKLDERVLSKLEELVEFGERVKQTKFSRSSGNMVYMGDSGVNSELAYQWGASCLNLLERVFGADSVHYRSFEVQFQKFRDYSPVSRALGIVRAAKDDYEQGFLFETRLLIEAEVFDDFLEQATHLLRSGYYQPAAVVAGSVLEDGLRKLCLRHEISVSAKPKLDTMNANLAKQGVYNKLTQKRITTLADLRNKAAHGEWDEFTEADVEDMLRSTRQFMETHFT
jgi:uncharacterized protein (UPF0332 family)